MNWFKYVSGGELKVEEACALRRRCSKTNLQTFKRKRKRGGLGTILRLKLWGGATSLPTVCLLALFLIFPSLTYGYKVWTNVNAQPASLKDISQWKSVAERVDGAFGGGNWMLKNTDADTLKIVYGHLTGKPIALEAEMVHFIQESFLMEKAETAGGKIVSVMPYREPHVSGYSDWGSGPMLDAEDEALVLAQLGDGYRVLPLIRRFEGNSKSTSEEARAFIKRLGHFVYEFGVPTIQSKLEDVAAAAIWAVENEVEFYLLTPPHFRNRHNENFIVEYQVMMDEFQRLGVDLSSPYLIFVPSGYRLELKNVPFVPEGEGNHYPNTVMGVTRWLLDNRERYSNANDGETSDAGRLLPGGIGIKSLSDGDEVAHGLPIYVEPEIDQGLEIERVELFVNTRPRGVDLDRPFRFFYDERVGVGQQSLVVRAMDKDLNRYEAEVRIKVVEQDSQAKKPNVILIFTDDQGYADLGVQGVVDDIRTPHIDSLAHNGARFTNGYVTAPQCSPSRAGLLTGRYQQRTGLTDNRTRPLSLEEITIADRLKAADYTTFISGKWHLDPIPQGPIDDPYLPAGRGFDEFFEMHCRHRDGFNCYVASHDLEGNPLEGGLGLVETRTEDYRIDIQTQAAVKFIERHPSDPFFLYVAYFAPHEPLHAPDEYLDRFPDESDERRRIALAMMSAVDDGVGRIMDTVREQGLEEDTLVIFLSDNGAPLKGARRIGSLNTPLSGQKGNLKEGGIRVPFIMSWPGVIPTQVYDQPVISLDIAATLLEVAGLGVDPSLDGADLMPYLTGKSKGSPHDRLFWKWRNLKAVREGKWKYHQNGDLFDLNKDIAESNNLSEKRPKVAARLQRALEEWESEVEGL